MKLIPTSNSRADFSYYLFHLYDLKKIYYNLLSGLRQSMNFIEQKYWIKKYVTGNKSRLDLLITSYILVD